jgi:hypothetical protein
VLSLYSPELLKREAARGLVVERNVLQNLDGLCVSAAVEQEFGRFLEPEDDGS